MKIRLKKVTIVAESLLRPQLLKLLSAQGATGHTITLAEGSGSRGVRASEWEGRNIQIDTIVDQATADALMREIAARFFDHFAVIAYASDVEVLRGEKFVPGSPS
ncbi:MAG: transcriptional regulator [Verrucomicrobia bacterium]|nr:MAG: transcriptional regulator [Verrucomicrobiota bacterium]TAE87150.1 MAG: transcriptional regulator [Verrucomicrobiota bacterium]TAF24954.1 MAG: transcriptional regulator [Verrucomicrobiota bacterium]TAF40719.1 MAG: transcriptional regulator [Verrucomicrobiota bacterium]